MGGNRGAPARDPYAAGAPRYAAAPVHHTREEEDLQFLPRQNILRCGRRELRTRKTPLRREVARRVFLAAEARRTYKSFVRAALAFSSKAYMLS